MLKINTIRFDEPNWTTTKIWHTQYES